MTSDRFSYPYRRRGLDHDWFPFEPTHARPPIAWPAGRTIALWITVPVEFFPLDAPLQPVRLLGALDRGYPDFWSYSNRDYGLRVGIFRIMKVLDALGLRATAAVNSAVATRYPRIISEIVSRNWDVAASGIDMGRIHHGGLAIDQERDLIRQARETLSQASGQPIEGWRSPGRSQSPHTLQLLAEQGFAYVMDWANDDLPYLMNLPAGPLCAMPLTHEWSDRALLVQHALTSEQYADQVLRAFRRLRAEAQRSGGGRLLSLSITPWILGYPHRIGALERTLRDIVDEDAVWVATGAEIARLCKTQMTAPG